MKKEEDNCRSTSEQTKHDVKKCKIKRLPSFLENTEVMRFLEVVDNPRDRFLFSALYYCGLRISEAIALKMEDFDLKNDILTVRAETAKRKKERHVPIPKAFKPLCKLWEVTLEPDCEIFHMCRSTANNLCKRYAQVAGISKKVSPHVLRHSYASHVLTMTNNLRLVQVLLGHENISTTARYLHLNDASLRKGIEGVFDKETPQK